MAKAKRTKTVRSRAEIVKLGRELVEWTLVDIDKPDTNHLSLRRFFINHRIHIDTASQWHKIPEFKLCWDLAKLIIDEKREMGMISKRFSEKGIIFTLHNYLPEWKETTEYHAQLRTQEQESGNIYLTIPKVSKGSNDAGDKDRDNAK